MLEKIAIAEDSETTLYLFTLSWEGKHPEHAHLPGSVFSYFYMSLTIKAFQSVILTDSTLLKISNNHHLLINVLIPFSKVSQVIWVFSPPSWKRDPMMWDPTTTWGLQQIAALHWRPSCWVSLICKEQNSSINNLICNKTTTKNPVRLLQVSILLLLHTMQLSAFEIKGKWHQKSQGQESTILKQGVSNVVFQPSTKGCFTGNFSGLMWANY